ncbi:uncharacterized protein J3R85_018123 [Psidium guajava]|nr:uncharacterized protein J3R85_018123 [Psidium guajava]
MKWKEMQTQQPLYHAFVIELMGHGITTAMAAVQQRQRDNSRSSGGAGGNGRDGTTYKRRNRVEQWT